jgi:hypothetical protein
MNPTTSKVKQTEPGAINDYHALDETMLEMQRSPETAPAYLEVTKEFFQALTRGTKTNYLTYGSPGVKIYMQGTKPAIDAEENLSAEDWRTLEIKRCKETGRKVS